MQIKITKEFLETNGACEEGKKWFFKQKASSVSIVINKLIEERKFEWANWTVTRLMTHKRVVKYACFSALQSIKEFEKVFPNDKRPREAIKAALRWVDDSTEANRSAAWSAAESAARSAAELAAKSAAWKKLLIYGVSLLIGKAIKEVVHK